MSNAIVTTDFGSGTACMRILVELPSNMLARYATYLKRVISGSDVVVRLLFEPRLLATLKEKACGLEPDRARQRGAVLSTLYRVTFELRPQRISSLINSSSIRNIFWANLRFSQRIKEAGLHAQLMESGMTVAAVPAKSRNVTVKLRYNRYINIEEGDFILFVECDGCVVHFLTFSFCMGMTGQPDQAAILIGGSQGCQPHLREFRRQLVRDCFDIAPEEVLILAIRGLARKFGCGSILAVGCDIHSKAIVDTDYEQMKPQLEIAYDMFWLSHAARRHSDYYLFDVSEDPISSTVPAGEHKARKLRKRSLKRHILACAEGLWESERA